MSEEARMPTGDDLELLANALAMRIKRLEARHAELLTAASVVEKQLADAREDFRANDRVILALETIAEDGA